MEGTGQYRLRILKWNGGKQGRKATYEYDRGQLVVMEGSECGTGGPALAASDVLLSFTYGVERAKLSDPATTEEERTAIERKCTHRVRQDGRSWKVGYGKDAYKIEPGHVMVKAFIERTGITQHPATHFIKALTEARQAGLLGYQESEQGVRGASRRPTGYCHPGPTVASHVEEDLEY
jgi:hypothetical protein